MDVAHLPPSSATAPGCGYDPLADPAARSEPMRAFLRGACILAVDDDPTTLQVMEWVLADAGYTNFHPLADPVEVLEVFRELHPDLVVLDLHLGPLSGLQVIDSLRPALAEDGAYLPILIVSGDLTSEARRQALSGGARDFLGKPYDADELLLRVRNLLEKRYLHLELQARNRVLEEEVGARTRELELAHLEVLERLARAAEYRDDATGRHTRRVGRLAGRIARALGLSDAGVEMIRRAAPLHDLGKIGVPDAVLLKPARLTAAERAAMETHTTIGAGLLSRGGSPTVLLAESIALSHHERWDGSGYPQGLSGNAILLEARIVAVADVFDALSHDRPYRPAVPAAAVRAEIARATGKHFDPEVARAFLRMQA
jgi:putative two-component system response regulator